MPGRLLKKPASEDVSRPSETIEIRSLDEQAAARGLVSAGARDPGVVSEIALLDERAVAGVEHRAWPELVRSQEVSQHPRPRTVQLRDGAEKEMTGELICGLRVEDVDGINPLAGRFTIERDPLEIDRFCQTSARLKRESRGQLVRPSLIRRDGIVEGRETRAGIGIDT